MFHVALLVTALLFFASRVIAAEGNLTEDESLKDMHEKLNDLWLNLMPKFTPNSDSDGIYYATCVLRQSGKLDSSELNVSGLVLFKQNYPNGRLEAMFDIVGFPTEDNQTSRAIHVHDFGDLSDGCDATGGHYNPFGVNHPRHPGDFGNFKPKDGKIRNRKGNLQATLLGPYSILGRSVVVHKLEDDLGKGGNQASLENGNAGKRLACCVIGISRKNMWEKVSQTFSEVKSERKIKTKKRGVPSRH
ncbi:extracellular superoxide dismutase [Cu-Zn] [Ambystoma mexicanum]|uniref:extracellular superoxide dismutase [Cu-Zn] n=1 Tax=Ambystoma mexicanum TaxID=8296 RepID=UPI0037E93EE6